MASPQSIQQFQTACKNAMRYELEELTTNPNWGPINFKDCSEDIVETRKFIKLWMHVDVSIVPESTLSQHRLKIEQFTQAIDQIKNFTIANNAEPRRNKIAEVLRTHREQLIPITATWLPFLLHQKDAPDLYSDQLEKRLNGLQVEVENFEKNRTELQKEDSKRIQDFHKQVGDLVTKRDEASKRTEEVLKKAENKVNALVQTTHDKTHKLEEDADKIIQAARKVAAEKAVAPYTHSFHNTADNWSGNATGWLVATCVLLGATGLWAYNGLKGEIPTLTATAEMIQYFSARLLITVLLVSAVWWSAKQFRIAMHQKTINQHKADALRSFEAFIEATNAPDVRDAVILQTSQTIFGQEATGYLDGQGEGSFEQYAKVAQSINSAAQIASKSS